MNERDALREFCSDCNEKLHEEHFALENVETQFQGVFDKLYRSREHRTCKACGALHPAPARFVDP